MHVIHLSAECYPVAKVGGLGDVVGALPKYLTAAGVKATVAMPYYENPFVAKSTFKTVFEGAFSFRGEHTTFRILKADGDNRNFDIYLIHIAGLLDRPEVYGYPDAHIQFIAFQIAFLEWLLKQSEKPAILHCHDHHTGLVPFLINYAYRYSSLKKIPTVLTIHNAQYQGIMGWENAGYLPHFDPWKAGLLDWNGQINPLAAAVKCCWKYTAVSPGYMSELPVNNSGLQELFRMERQKGTGILNGIDTEIWNPSTDKFVTQPYTIQTVKNGKHVNKEALCAEFNLDPKKPLISFIGRLAGEKGADLLPEIITETLENFPRQVSFLVLGSGDYFIENSLAGLKQIYPTQCAVYIGYNEELSHRVYAGTDFLIMPSRVEPCGLNQLYSLRYGTMPIVNRVGGLKDTVIDFQDSKGGYGICFEAATVTLAFQAIKRAIKVFGNAPKLDGFQKKMMALDFSWQHAAEQYIDLYKTLKPL